MLPGGSIGRERSIEREKRGAGLMTAGAGGHDGLPEYIDFRIRTAVGGMLALVVLFVPTLLTWFSDNPHAGSAPASGLIDHWNLWAVMSSSQGGGASLRPDGLPAGFSIGGLESGLAQLVLAGLAVTLVMVLLTAARGRWGMALATAIGAAVTFGLEMVLRFAGNGDHQGQSGPHSYNTGVGLALAQWAAVAVVAWALYVLTVARRDWRQLPGGRPEALVTSGRRQA
jgi:hypothetical protein